MAKRLGWRGSGRTALAVCGWAAWWRAGGGGGRVLGEVGFGLTLVEVVLAADLAGEGGHAVAIGGVDEVGCGETAVVVVGEVGEVFADEG